MGMFETAKPLDREIKVRASHSTYPAGTAHLAFTVRPHLVSKRGNTIDATPKPRGINSRRVRIRKPRARDQRAMREAIGKVLTEQRGAFRNARRQERAGYSA